MGPWGYVLATNRSGAEALAIVECNSKPTYNAIVARLDLIDPGISMQKRLPCAPKGERVTVPNFVGRP